jgi:hypothetical protein
VCFCVPVQYDPNCKEPKEVEPTYFWLLTTYFRQVQIRSLWNRSSCASKADGIVVSFRLQLLGFDLSWTFEGFLGKEVQQERVFTLDASRRESPTYRLARATAVAEHDCISFDLRVTPH